MSNSIHSINPTICHYLFGKEAEQVFESSPHAYLRTNKNFVEECLHCCIRVHLFFLSQKQGFFLIDPAAHNNQCHLYALKAARIQVLYSHKTEEEKLAQTEENRFIHLALFLSYFFKEPNAYLKIIEETLKQTGQKAPTPKKHFQAFLRDEGSCRERASRLALNELFRKDLLKSLSNHPSPLYSELHTMALEDLEISQDAGFGVHHKEKIYTYPKIVGVAYLIDVIAKENIAMVLKVKILTAKGAGGVILQTNREIQPHEPTLVFEAVATEDSYSLTQFKKEARNCPTYTYRHPEKNKLHDEKKPCFFCTKHPVDLVPFQERIKTAMQSPEKMLYALGADFVVTAQQSFQPLFANYQKYPLLSALFEEALSDRQKLGLVNPDPQAFSMFHVHTEIGSEALSEKMALDRSSEMLLKERGIL